MLCPSCSTEVPVESRFCGACGQEVDPTSALTRTGVGRRDAPSPTPTSSSIPKEARFLPGAMVAGRYRIVGLLGRFTPDAKEVVYTRKGGQDTSEPGDDERIDAEEFVARVLVQIPDPRRHLVRYYGAYSNRARGQRRKAEGRLEGNGSSEAEEPVPPPAERAALRRRWANLIRRVYEVDPLVCPRCGAEMRVIGFITEPGVIKRILDRLRKRDRVSRPPPPLHGAVASIA